MAEKEIVAQIDKLRKTRPARAVEAMTFMSDALSDQRTTLVTTLSMLRDDLKDEARLVEQAKLRGGTSIMKDRLAVAGWLELFVVQLGRESDETGQSTAERLSPSHELTEHRPSERGTNAAVLPGPGGRCAVGNVHTTSTTKCPCGLDLTASGGPHYLSDETIDANEEYAARQPLTTRVGTGEIEAFLSGASDTLPALSAEHAAELDAIIDSDLANYRANHPSEPDVRTAVEQRLGIHPAEQQAHDTIDRELAHVTADPFAPIPRAVWAPAVPPNGRAWTTADLLAPVDAASLPPHLSFSQAATAVECGAKYRMQRIANVPQVPQWANVGGKAFHAAVEFIEHNTGAMIDHPGLWNMQLEEQIHKTEQASGMTREQFRASGQGREGYDWWRVEGAAMLQRYVDWRQGDGAGDALLSGPTARPMLEWETTYDVDGVPFRTILDSVWRSTDASNVPATAIIRDWKTGSMTPDNRQLCTQAWGLRKAGWQGEILVQFFDARKGTFSEPFDPFGEQGMSWDDVRYFVLSADAQRRLPILPARPSDFCGGCPVAYACPIMSQRKQPKAATK